MWLLVANEFDMQHIIVRTEMQVTDIFSRDKKTILKNIKIPNRDYLLFIYRS